MKKIISLYKRNHETNSLVTSEVTDGAEWVINGEGIATRKWDGTCCRVDGMRLWKRYDAKRGKTPPSLFEAAQDPDPTTGHWPGWIPVSENNPADRWHLEALNAIGIENLEEGTYELCGEKIQGNPEHIKGHILIQHGKDYLLDAPRTFDALKYYFETHDIEGIVWWTTEGRMVKIKGRDFGIKRPTSNG